MVATAYAMRSHRPHHACQSGQPQLLTVDCTLRDGEQAAGVYFTVEEKVSLARQLDRAGVSILDAGFPVVSPEERQALAMIASDSLRAAVFATVRPDPEEIRLARDLGADGVFLFFPVSAMLRELVAPEEAPTFQERIRLAVRYGLQQGLEVMVVLEDAGRAGREAELDSIERLRREGVTTFIVAESVGALTPWAMQEKIAALGQAFPEVQLGIHCHNDYGLATANSLAAIQAGARVFTGTVNGLGERAGNAPVEEVIVAAGRLLGLRTDVRPEALADVCQLVEECSGMVNSPIKPVCGSNIFKCESGLHSKALLRKEGSYEAFSPELLGRQRRFVLGKHTGRECLKHLLEQRGIRLEPEQLDELLARVKSYQERHKDEGARRFVLKARQHYRDDFGLPEDIIEWLAVEVVNGA